jgi:hypothetical protein
MGIPESQFETWAKQGSITQSSDTYGPIKAVLESANAPYASRKKKVFLQGSYGNDTNIYGESDVDIVIRLEDVWHHDLSRLSQEQAAAYKAYFSDGTYSQSSFRDDVFKWLSQNYNGVTPGKKAIDVPPNGKRRSADVLAALQFRRYYEFIDKDRQRFAPGVCFFYDGKLIENFPEQHSANCTKKHQDTSNWFKPVVRTFKNMRSVMRDEGMIGAGVAPSYFIEGMLYNVPKEQFGGTYVDTFARCFNWISNAAQDKLVCANGLHFLIRSNESTSWPAADFGAYMQAVRELWDGW